MRGLSLEVKPRELVALLGPSGCGKTTTLRLVAGFLKPDAGEIWVGEHCLSSPTAVVAPERRRMAMIFQSYALWPHMTVAQNVAYGLRFKDALSRDERQRRVREMLSVVQLGGYEARYLEETLRRWNGVPGDPASFDALDRLLSEQTYRLADWRVAGDEVNYRRFFDVSHLAAIRMERRPVFDATHELVLRLVGEGKVNGLRVDHPDGLYAPGEYFRRLQEGALIATARRLLPEIGEAETDALAALHQARAAEHAAGAEARPIWIAAEKILGAREELPEWWTVAGTTGYDFLASVNGLFVDR